MAEHGYCNIDPRCMARRRCAECKGCFQHCVCAGGPAERKKPNEPPPRHNTQARQLEAVGAD